MNIKLPDLQKYKARFVDKGLHYPLPVVKTPAAGLLKTLPPPPADKTGWPWTVETAPALYADNAAWPKLTIVTPSYNQDKFIEETIRSVLLQNYPNLEYIVMDGGSTDNTKRVLEKYSPWISYWQSKKDNGQSHAINMGFSLADGEYLAWINSDDYYLQSVFHAVVNRFLQSKAAFVYGYGYNKSAGEDLELVKMLPLLDYFIKIPSLIQPSCFWKSTIHQPIWEELHCALDYELWLRMVKGARKSLISEPLSVTNIHDDAKTHDPKMAMKWQEDHLKIWAEDAHGSVPEWKRITFLHRLRKKVYEVFSRIQTKVLTKR
jgi:glycosyltransferase involved in cell wall biosynthesis